jgi:colanic acid biosynthesis glycosyl transferase WcaI
MRILFLTQWFHPEPAFKGLPFARALQDLGHEVEVYSGFPNYPGGKIYEGYAIRPVCRETIEGIRVTRFPLYPSHDRSSLRRVLNYGSFAASLTIGGTALARGFNVMYVYHPPLTVGIAASLLSSWRGLPFVYDVQDLWPDTLRATGMVKSDRVLKLVNRACERVYRKAGAITVLSPGFKRTLVERGVPRDKVEVIYNWADEQNLALSEPDGTLAKKLGFAGHFNVVFAGTMGKAQALDSVLEAARLLQSTNPRVLISFVGGGIEGPSLKERAKSMGLSNVQFLSHRPMSEIGGVLKLADILLVHLKDDHLFRITVPSKIQTYMAVGKPILVAVEGDAAELVTTAEAGVVCPPENPPALAAAIGKMASMDKAELCRFGERGKVYYERELSMRAGVRKFESILKSIAT